MSHVGFISAGAHRLVGDLLVTNTERYFNGLGTLPAAQRTSVPEIESCWVLYETSDIMKCPSPQMNHRRHKLSSGRLRTKRHTLRISSATICSDIKQFVEKTLRQRDRLRPASRSMNVQADEPI